MRSGAPLGDVLSVVVVAGSLLFLSAVFFSYERCKWKSRLEAKVKEIRPISADFYRPSSMTGREFGLSLAVIWQLASAFHAGRRARLEQATGAALSSEMNEL
jgi:hypothetical protein